MTARARRVARCGGALSLLIAACCIGDTASAGIDRATLSAAPLRESLPLRFEENRGQFDAAVRFAVRTANGAILIAADGTTTLLHGGPDETSAPVRLRFAGSRGASDIFGEDRTRTISNYYVGRDASAWRSDVPSFRRVRAEDVYPGIDVIYRANGPALEYDFALMPGANPARIALDFSGADAIRIDRAGDLVVQSRDDTVIHRKPVAYQSGRGGSRAVEARYVRRGAGRIGIELGRYDRRRPLVIDPFVELRSTYLGGSASDKALAVAADAAGNTYVVGMTQSLDFPVAGAIQPAHAGATDAFVAKINAAGSALVWSTYFGGTGLDAAFSIARDAAGDIYVAGNTASSDFPVTPNAAQPGFGGVEDAFVAKFGPAGTLAYSTLLGGSDLDVANGVVVSPAGEASVSGFTCSADFPVANAFQPQIAGLPVGCFSAKDAFLTALAADGSSWLRSTYYGGSGMDEAKAIAIDAQGRVAIAGLTDSSDLPTSGTPLMSHQGLTDAFVARFAAGALDYMTYYGGSDDDAALALAIDTKDAIHVAGSTRSADFPIANAFQSTPAGGTDGFVLKLVVPSPPMPPSILYASYLGGGEDDVVRAIAVDDGYAYLAGETRSFDFPQHLPLKAMLTADSDAFVSRVGPKGALVFSTYFGGDGDDAGHGIALNKGLVRGYDTMHVVGTSYSSDLAMPGALQPVPPGAPDGFVAKLGFVP